MTIAGEEVLISPPPAVYKSSSSSRPVPPQSIRIDCLAEQHHFINTFPVIITGSLKPIRFSPSNQPMFGQYRSEIVVHNNPNADLYIKRLRVGFNAHEDATMPSSTIGRPSSRSHSAHSPPKQRRRQQEGKPRPVSLPRSSSQAALHQWIDDICSNKKLLADDDICFFLKNGEFLARI